MGIAQSNPETGEYEIRLPGGELYGVHAEAEGFMSENQNLDLRNFKTDGVVTHKDLSINPIEVARIEPNATIRLNNISSISTSSYCVLNLILNLIVLPIP